MFIFHPEGIVIATLYLILKLLCAREVEEEEDVSDDPTWDSLPGSVKINEE